MYSSFLLLAFVIVFVIVFAVKLMSALHDVIYICVHTKQGMSYELYIVVK